MRAGGYNLQATSQSGTGTHPCTHQPECGDTQTVSTLSQLDSHPTRAAARERRQHTQAPDPASLAAPLHLAGAPGPLPSDG